MTTPAFSSIQGSTDAVIEVVAGIPTLLKGALPA